ncbi:mannose-1-phosphate guanylyltransferase [Halobellus captivus]|uniref:mannose-1-phosphate guanylyltransferase n=1 Tax=Halobellus captivus TaxID=2592614 RepID=UPI0011A8992F|nr:sugar phosphate nucleotidyltransferase [Halobellus captivus]
MTEPRSSPATEQSVAERPAAEQPATDDAASLPVVAAVLAGGTGSRLYPASRSDRPKQFLSLAGGGKSLLERTVDRAREVADEVVVVTRESYRDGVAERVGDGVTVLVEPAGRDTGPALLYATHRISRRYDDCVLLSLPSDHLVGEGFADAVRRGTAVAATEDRLVTFGVEPTRPETGYGYIEAAGPGGETEWQSVRSFHEKPDAATAAAYVEAGHYWNAGLFAWRPEILFDAVERSPLAPLSAALAAADDSRGAADGTVTAAFESIDPVSVDNAVFETADDVAVVPVSFPWDDVGAWDALERVLDADANGNVSDGDVTLRTVEAEDNVVVADDAHVSLVGVSDLAVVAWDGRVLVVPKAQAQKVKSLVRSLQDRGEF